LLLLLLLSSSSLVSWLLLVDCWIFDHDIVWHKMRHLRRTMNARRTLRLAMLLLAVLVVLYLVYWLAALLFFKPPVSLSLDLANIKAVTMSTAYNWANTPTNKAGWTPMAEDALCFAVPGKAFIGKRCAPSFIIAGAMKCGTTSLYAYLTRHPQIEPVTSAAVDYPRQKVREGSRRALVKKQVLAAKEVRFWMDPNYNKLTKELGGIDEALQWYFNLFDPIQVPSEFGVDRVPKMRKIAGEATPMYIVCSVHFIP
jgi:hypothetical protein